MKKLLVFAVVLSTTSLLSLSCSNNGSDEGLDMPDSVKAKALDIAEGQLTEIVKNISSPVEIGVLLQQVNAPYSEKYLATTEHIDAYNTNFKRALNLGIMGVDLGYMSMYKKTMSMMSYVSSIKNLADNLGVGQFYDFNQLKRMITSSYNVDSMAYMSVESFNQMDDYLHKNKRSNISALIVTGLWLESLYLPLQIYMDKPKDEIAQRIGEQKIIISSLVIILENFAVDPSFAELTKDVKRIKQVYDKIKITIEMGEPETIEKDGMLTIVQNETSHVEISEAQVKEINKLVTALRTKIISE